MRFVSVKDTETAGRLTALYIQREIEAHRPTSGRPFVLGLPTGSTPLMTYRALIDLYKKGEVSFKNVVTFNMDEYVGLAADHPQSYNRFMWDNFFSHVDIPRENIHIPDGLAKDLEGSCADYEKKMKDVGGVDLFLGGLGANGHIAFNEPGSSLKSRMRVISLTENTILQNARFFDNRMDQVPRQALSIGVETFMESRKIALLALGATKALAVREALEGPVSNTWPVTVLQFHPETLFIADLPASEELRFKTLRYYESLADTVAPLVKKAGGR